MVREHIDDPLTRFRAQDLAAAFADSSRKQDMVTPMFDVIAPRYDAFTRLFSFGMDATWKHELLTLTIAQCPTARLGIDAACGTGDIAYAFARALPAVRMIGVDPSAEMLALASARAQTETGTRVSFLQGELASLPSSDQTVDVISAGYGFRNVPELSAAIAECARVLKPGGVLASLDFFAPRNTLWRALFLWYLRVSGNVVGWLWHRTPAVYGYIAHSIAAFVTHDEFTALLRHHGFRLITERRYLLGGIGIHIAVRNPSE
jgi:demethylmenaquinone methyltransferase / 2-methoxy-6-polyprenyl-1,4-benzoquinol methylase